MIRVVTFTHQELNLPVFIDDTDTGYTGKDVMTKPGIYEDVTSSGLSLYLAELAGSVNGYKTKCLALLAVGKEGAENPPQIVDCTGNITQLLTVPETAAKMMINNLPEEQREFAQTALDVMHYYEAVTAETKVFLPAEAFAMVQHLEEKMRSTRQSYVLKHSDNQEIVQRDCTSVFGVPLPPVEELHSKSDCSVKALDILRVIAPCRKPVGDKGAFQYNGIYHTPYYRIDPKIRGAVPSYLESLRGYHKNDTLGIQNNERHMRDNLRTFVQADIAMYVAEITTALYLSTRTGMAIKKLLACKNEELLSQLISEIAECDEHGVKCTISYSDIKDAVVDGMSVDRIAAVVGRHIEFTDTAIREMVTAQIHSSHTHVADIENLPFVLSISDELKGVFTALFIENSVITRAMLDFLLNLCVRAYEVNWGHTGAARAISRFVNIAGVNLMNDVLGAYLSQTIGGIQAPASIDFTLLYSTQIKVAPDDDELDDSDDGLFVDFDYYITNDTAMKIRAGASTDLFAGGSSAAETSETAIVEYWRKVDGSNNLQYFISSAFTSTGDVGVIFEAFLKLMRWGSVKPALLVFQDKPAIRTVFDLNTGKEIPNTAIVDESQLVLSNGCQYSLECLLTAEDVTGAAPVPVGLLLSKNYGIKKFFMASFVDLGEMIERSEVDIDAFKTVTSIPLTEDGTVPIASLENSGYAFLTSNRNIELGLEYGIAPAQLSELALLCIGGILRSADYLRSKQNTMAVTTKDRQYQILSTYCDTLRAVYAEDSELLSSSQVSTTELSALALTIYKKFLEGGKKQAPGVNQVRSQNAVMAMQLDVDNARVLDCALVGKFTIVHDMDMQSSLPSIEFSDPAMQRVSNMVRDRIVMLMLETEDAFVLCRKDISPNDLLVTDHKIEHRKYSTFASVIKALLGGQTVNLSNSKTGVKHQVYLHPSLRELL